MADAADRTGPSYDLLPDALLNAAPVFPFFVCPTNGFFVLDPAAEYDPAPVAQEIVLTGFCTRTTHTSIVVDDTNQIAVCGTHVLAYKDGWDSTQTGAVELMDGTTENTLNEQKWYIFRLSPVDKDNLTVKIFEYGSGSVISEATLQVTDLFAANPVFHVGHATDAQRVGLLLDGFRASNGIKIIRTQTANPGPTDITVTPATASTTEEAGDYVGQLWAEHARPETLPCTFALATGTGDDDNALFEIRGINLYIAGTLTAGAKSIYVEATDKYGASFGKALTITVS